MSKEELEAELKSLEEKEEEINLREKINKKKKEIKKKGSRLFNLLKSLDDRFR